MTFTDTQIITCGVDGHDEACLCDVIVGSPTEITFGTDTMWHAERVHATTEYGHPWTGKSFADFMDTIVKAHDMWAAQHASTGEGWNSSNQNSEPPENTVLRDKVLTMLRRGESMTDVPRALGMTYKQIITAMTFGSPSVAWGWDDQKWLDVEALIYDEFKNNGYEKLADLLGHGATWRTAQRLAEWYGVTINQSGQERLDLMRAALVDGMSPADAETHFRALGYTCSKKQLGDMRRRLVARGDIT